MILTALPGAVEYHCSIGGLLQIKVLVCFFVQPVSPVNTYDIICFNTLFDENMFSSYLHTNLDLHLFVCSLMILLCLRVA